MFYAILAYGLANSLDVPHETSHSVEAVTSYLFVTSLALWVLVDANQRQRPLPCDYGSFVFFGWIVVVPLYLWSTRQWRAFARRDVPAPLHAGRGDKQHPELVLDRVEGCSL